MGTCTHVWNYEQTLAWLFPQLERSIRTNEFTNSMAPRRTNGLPHADPRQHATLDGPGNHPPPPTARWAPLSRAYRDWHISGDDSFLKNIYPSIKKALEFAWSEKNAFLWDRDRDGLMEGRQHNTYDIEFFGPNPLCTLIYLAALRATAEMADYLGDADAANDYRKIYRSGKAKLENELFNGEYFVQNIHVADGLDVPDHLIAWPALADKEQQRKNKAKFEIMYQIGTGCLSDQLVGQFNATFAGLGDLISRTKIIKTLKAIHKYNFKNQLRDVENCDPPLRRQRRSGIGSSAPGPTATVPTSTADTSTRSGPVSSTKSRPP